MQLCFISKEKDIAINITTCVRENVGRDALNLSRSIPGHSILRAYPSTTKKGEVTAKKCSFPLRISSVNDSFTEEIINGKLHFLYSEYFYTIKNTCA